MTPVRICNIALAALLMSAAAVAVAPADAAKKTKPAKAAKAKPPGAGLKPEQVADMYIQVQLKDDVETAKRLNDYARSEFSGKDSIDLAELAQTQQLYRSQYEVFADGLLASMAKVKAKKAKPALVEAMMAQSAAAARSDCHAASSKNRPNEYVKGQIIAEVSYECRVPAIEGGLKQRLESQGAPDKINTKKALAVFNGYQKAFADVGDKTRIVHGTLSLYGFPGRPWITSGAGEITQVVTDGMLNAPAAAE